jgi:hypothetical protein
MTQYEIPGTESPDRDPELHALALELYDLQSQRMDLTKREKATREEAAALLHRKKLDSYHCDGVQLWLEPSEKVKVRYGSDGGDE